MFASYIVALLTLLDRLKSLSGINAAIQRGLAAAESIFGLLDREDEPDTGTVALDARARRARFDRVSLRYAGDRARGARRRVADDPARARRSRWSAAPAAARRRSST